MKNNIFIKVIGVAACLIAAAILVSCDSFPSFSTSTSLPVTDDEQVVGFFKKEPDDLFDSPCADAEQYIDYTSTYSKYNTYTYYSSLSDEEKLIYRIFEYAVDNSCQYIIISDGLLSESALPIENILYLLSLDSPVVEQNLYIKQKTQTKTYISGSTKTEYKKHLFTVTAFNEEKLDKKDQAIKKGEQVVSTIPLHLTYEDKAREIYKYLGQNITYSTYEKGEEPNYLFDALCTGKTQCDGFANAFSLLCNMVGIPCIEKCYVPTDGSEGHTWNSFMVDGKWYNADVTGYSGASKFGSPVSLFFGYSDELQTNQHQYGDRISECNDVLEVDCTFQNESLPDIVDKIKTAYNDKGKGYVIIFFDTPTKNPENLMQSVADELRVNISYTAIANRLYCIYQGETT